LAIREGANWLKLEKPASGPAAAQRVNAKTLERRADIWGHESTGDAQSLTSLLGRPRIERLLIQLPDSVTQEFQSVVRSQKLDRSSAGQIVLTLGPPGVPLDPNEINSADAKLSVRR
jgi:hypothetical protein